MHYSFRIRLNYFIASNKIALTKVDYLPLHWRDVDDFRSMAFFYSINDLSEEIKKNFLLTEVFITR